MRKPHDTGPRSVCHLSTRLVKGGADFNIFYNLMHSAPRYAQTLVIGAEYDAGLVAQLRDAGVRVVVIDSICRSISPRYDASAFCRLWVFFRREHFDIVYTHNAKTGILGRFAAPRRGRGGWPPPVVVHGLHGMSFTPTNSRRSYLLFRALERAAAPRTDHFVSVGFTIRDLMLAAGVGRPEQYRVIRSGMALDRFRSAAKNAERIRALRAELGCTSGTVLCVMVARIEYRKGQHRFLQAFAQAALAGGPGVPELRAAVVGDGAARAACEVLAQELGIGGRVVFTGFQDKPEEYLAAADIVCLSSEWEGVPQSLVQAAAVGRPAVAFDVPGIREILSDGRTGTVVPYPDIHAFAAALQRLAADPALRSEYGTAAGCLDLEEFRLDNMVSRTEALYRELCGGAGSSVDS